MGFTKTNLPMASVGMGGPVEGLWTPTVDQKHRIGERYEDAQGRVWRYISNNTTELAAGLMTAAETIDAEALNETQTGYTTSIGDTSIRALLSTGNALSNGELQDGWLSVVSSTGLGYVYAIANNTWITSDTVMHIELYDPIRVATSATSVFTFCKNPWRDVVVNPTTSVTKAAGVSTCVIPASYYGWVQTRGPCGMLRDTSETLVLGCYGGMAATCNVAGAVGLPAEATLQLWGKVLSIAADAQTAIIDLCLE